MQIIVLDYTTCQVENATMSDSEAKRWVDNIEGFITEVMGYDLDDIHYMVANKIKINSTHYVSAD